MAGKFRQIIEVVMKGAGKTASDTKKIQKGLQGVAKDAAKIGAAFYAAKGGINATQNFVNNALAVEQLTPAFDNLRKSMGFSVNTLDSLNRAVNGTVKQVDLMRTANQAMTLGVVDSEEGFADLFDTAQRLGKSLGVDTLSAIDSLVTGMGRQSIMMLDNLGIIVDTQKAYDDYAKSIGKASSELTDQEKKIAFNAAALESAQEKVKVLGDENLTAADSFARFSKASNDFGVAFSNTLMPIMEGATNIASGLIESINELLGITPPANAVPSTGLSKKQIEEMVETEGTQYKINRATKELFAIQSNLVEKLREAKTEQEVSNLLVKDFGTVAFKGLINADKVAKAYMEQVITLEDIKKVLSANTDIGIANATTNAAQNDILVTGLYLNNELNTEAHKKAGVAKRELKDKIELNITQKEELRLAQELLEARRQVASVTNFEETATAYQAFVDTQFESLELEKQNADLSEEFINNYREKALALGMVSQEQMTFTESFSEFSQLQKDNLEQQQLQQDMIDNFIVMYPEQAEALGLVHSALKAETKMYEEEEAAQKKANDARKEAIALMRTQVDMSMALGASHINAGQAALEAAGVFITAKIQEIVANYIAGAFAEGGFYAGLGAVATGAAFGSLVGQTVQSVGKMKFAAEGMNEVVTEPTLIMAGEEGAEYVNIEPTQNEGAGMGGGGQIIFQGNVLSKDFIEDEAIPMIRDAVRRGHTLA